MSDPVMIADRIPPAEVCEHIALLEAALRVHAERTSWGELVIARETWDSREGDD